MFDQDLRREGLEIVENSTDDLRTSEQFLRQGYAVLGMEGRILIVAPVVVHVLSGCALVVVPVPTGHGTVRSGTMVPETAASSLRVGETRRADVLANLGPPARRFDDLRIDAYGWTDVSWYFPWLFVVAAGGPPPRSTPKTGQ